MLSCNRESQQPVSCEHSEAWGIAGSWTQGMRLGRNHSSPKCLSCFARMPSSGARGSGGRETSAPSVVSFSQHLHSSGPNKLSSVTKNVVPLEWMTR